MFSKDDPLYKEMQAQIDALKSANAAHAEFAATTLKEKWELEAEKHYQKLFTDNKILPTEKVNFCLGYSRACEDNAKLKDTVDFDAAGDGKLVKGTRVEAYLATFANRTPHNLTEELLKKHGISAEVLFSNGEKKETTAAFSSDKEREEMLNMTELGRQTLAAEKKAAAK